MDMPLSAIQVEASPLVKDADMGGGGVAGLGGTAAPNLVHIVAVAAAAQTPRAAGPLLTRLSGAALGCMLAATILGLVVLSQYTTAVTTRSASLLICSEDTGSSDCTTAYFEHGWCRPGQTMVNTYSGGAIGVSAPDGGTWSSTSITSSTPSTDEYGCGAELDTGVTCEELPCPENYVNPDTLLIEGVLTAAMFCLAVGMMAAFPGACNCCEAGQGCSGHTAGRIATFATALAASAFAVVAGGGVGYAMHQGEAEPIPPALLAILVSTFPLAAFGER